MFYYDVSTAEVIQRGMNSEWTFVNFKLDLLYKNSFKVAEKKHEEYFNNMLGIKTEFNANKLPTWNTGL